MALRRLIKRTDVSGALTLQETSVYAHVKAGLLPPPIKLTRRSSAWVEDEIAAVSAARIAGKSDAEIRQLVTELVAARTQPAP